MNSICEQILGELMGTPTNSNTQERHSIDEVINKIKEIAHESSEGEYIYRGEPECYAEVSSGLYRQYKADYEERKSFDIESFEVEKFDIELVQEEILNRAKRYTSETDDFEILSELQHFGGKTNLIDFTTDYLIALFFACDGFHGKDGRIIVLSTSGCMSPYIKKPRSLNDRITAQKSTFVQPPTGIIEPDNAIIIPFYLKPRLLDYLLENHGISSETIYHDLLGFIRYQELHEVSYAEYYRGIAYEDEFSNKEAIEHYTKAIELNPQLADAYGKRGFVYTDEGEYDLAIRDFTNALELVQPTSIMGKFICSGFFSNRGYAYAEKGEYEIAIQDYSNSIRLLRDSNAFNNRGFIYSKLGEVDSAIQDFSEAIDIESDSATAYHNRGAEFLKKGSVDSAISDLSTALSMFYNLSEREMAAVYFERGNAYYHKGELGLALQDFSKSIELMPENDRYYYYRGAAYSNNDEISLAIRDLDKSIDLHDGNPYVYYNRGWIWLRLKEWQKARIDMATAINLGFDVPHFFRHHNGYFCVADFEQRQGFKVPKDIAEMLGG